MHAIRYCLSNSLTDNYILNRGLRPSGFAQIKVTIEPMSESTNSLDVRLTIPSHKYWAIRLEDDSDHNELARLERQITGFLPTILKGIQDGFVEGFQTTLEYPVTSVNVLLREIVIDPFYSTEKAFYIASKRLVEQILTQAQQNNELCLMAN
ncbi:MAG: hypothetical protein R3A44_41180 [Caldilineaceae bacterium]